MNRYRQLDSLRGLAALSVLLHHFLLILPEFYKNTFSNVEKVNIMKYSPLHIFFAGHEAVVLFFVLSGFVLAIPMLVDRRSIYSMYLIKRILRIYMPYIVALFISIIAAKIFYSGNIIELSTWFNKTFEPDLNTQQIIQHFLLIPNFYNYKLNPVIWSLVQEMRISIIFPFVVIFISRFKSHYVIMTSLMLSFVGLTGDILTNNALYIPNDYFITLHCLALFILGGLLAKHRNELIQSVRTFTKSTKIILLISAILTYTYAWWFFYSIRIVHLFIDDWMTALGVSFFIILAISSYKVSKALTLRPLIFMGNISYSLYLYHSIVLLSITHLLFGKVNISIIWTLSLIITFIVAVLSYYFVEQPSIKLGKELTQIYKAKYKLSQVKP
ncbi:Peptidoglycan/LPS O-acetylase OafA/YrhL, contains acyltransferase and SGNH-hydrolase domains [Paenibacillus sp. yr247]|uniref:acyltransferase family protein n=1 Tax=Paenibacillus sp. yr247 TaxID=1761880 RepID=UPI0008907B9E|nr:acyltransferase [Paenibacillus sp. yr247]SDP05863.1 Peptidoglycan/LPS O-acetylase OafA/YrhL, contains acyltransferase and SGNH-hydrolase domains [Paenibacillus sp. yr247]